MSVGGKVVEVIELENKVWINTKEKETYTSSTAIYVEKTPASRCVEIGDTVWWQGNYARWTPKCYVQKSGKSGKDYDIKLERIGCSGVSRPVI